MCQLMVGVGQEVITPPVGTMLQGYTPPRPALSVHDDLHATAFAFQTGKTQALLISVDMCNIPHHQEQIRDAILHVCDVPRTNIIVACTHTHSGPHSMVGTATRPNFMDDMIIPRIAMAAQTAVKALRPAQMGIGTTYSDVAMNRRQIREDGKVVLGQDPHGSWDPEMTVISFREPDGKPIGNLIHYGCHNTASGINDEITRDWCGVMVDRLQEQSGGITAFINGSAGDCGPRLPNGRTIGNLQMAMELGGKAAIDAVRAWRSIRIWREAPLRVLHGQIQLPIKQLGTLEQTQKEIEKLGDPQKLTGTKLVLYNNYTARAAYLKENNGGPEAKTLEHTLIALGPLVFQAVPFEPFSTITLRIKKHSPFPYTLCVGYANGSNSYFPSMDQLIRGGYEVQLFVTKPVPFADDAEQYYLEGSLKLLRELYEK